MTRGNQRDVDRERAQRRNQKAVKNSTIKDADKNLSVVCDICKQSFMCTVKKPTLDQHVESRHPKNVFKDCFPKWET
ncbi:zinc-binding protein [Toxoplasma gondii TgCatPRC2]|uniref:Cgd4-790 n=14 Tax=Toxoplasma gondii TaxID=5811 RepID=A0A125YFC3_TOXGV|nr:hypothetical protein TGME49_284630 [Toxoplasma gondii ME49]EPR59323.1 hypothetical protein TGGT1_284630 [Toxoplasma gondii GT1]ESS30541.1 Cgd4-790 [Toxoplasma gondii VEG]KFG39819.1 zinc-binding protein [Toxoplasma gondii GAB2-2007-GAL-DOM2]KFG45211.1 hypothetical protein TGP89_284630 [Toxoplasma gondii p89]KFG54677.1 hypothetical protein TGFOU_284630 [Toxoplasma gondii FOU]KFG63379.1 hypothetical protein TGRUB_284630 [Toxoplasma gondii RUB]KFH01297.1 hypothetical protein TGMAS_284630 [Tox|eukprot:XP_008888793.1 hypothetical protein HHA_284630 [Hammondia hammondi]